MAKRKRRRVGKYKSSPSGGKFKLGMGSYLALHGVGNIASGAAAAGLGVGAAGVAAPVLIGGASVVGGAALVRAGYRSRYLNKQPKRRGGGRRGRGGAKKGHAFFGNQYTKIARYTRGRVKKLKSRFGRRR